MEFDDDLEFLGFMDVAEDPPALEPVEPEHYLSSSDINKLAGWAKPFPLPGHLTPKGPIDWSDVDDETLMNAPPHLIVHLQRTAAQRGLQVISPRQTPLSSLMGRTRDSRRELGDYVVGSVASRAESWPTIDNADMSHLLPDEPLPPIESDRASRVKTRTDPLTKAGHLMRDPILACLIKGRAVMDVMRRDDVGGDADTMGQLLADAWGVPVGDLMEMDAYTLGIEGPLLRHAIRADDVYPMVHAPIHHKLCVSVGNSEITRELLPEDSAMDWRRMRVFCEAVFLMSCSIEGIPLEAVKCHPPPGDPTAPLDRPNIMAFRPMPCTAWSFEARSFSIWPVYSAVHEKNRQIPPDVLQAMSRYVEEVRPVSHAMKAGLKTPAVRSALTYVEPPEGETILETYDMVLSRVTTGSARGKTSSAAVRNVVYETMESCNPKLRMKLARYFQITGREVKRHLGLDIVPDGIIDRIATKFLAVGDTVRLKVAAEATRRGYTVEEWWEDITALVPVRYKEMTEGTMGWARVAMWLMFRHPTPKWQSLTAAIHISAMKDADFGSIGGIPLPPERGSPERMLAAARYLVKETTSTYSGYYVAVYDIAQSIADELDWLGRARSADIMREAAYLWMLRARSLRGTNVQPIAKDKPTPSMNHLRVEGTVMDLLVVPAPYRAFKAYKKHAESSHVLSGVAKKMISGFCEPKISNLFRELPIPLSPAPESDCTRYLVNPIRLADDMERSWRELAGDVRKAVEIYALENRPPEKRRKLDETLEILDTDMGIIPLVRPPKKDGKTYYDLMGEMEADEVDWFEDMLANMPATQLEELMARTYPNLETLRVIFFELEMAQAAGEKAAIETVQ